MAKNEEEKYECNTNDDHIWRTHRDGFGFCLRCNLPTYKKEYDKSRKILIKTQEQV